uniref:Probable DNA polymerase n=1 Tax=Butyriboletus roseoflavus TaxID=1325616 RepID=A0A8K1ZR06_9AGAM|nr:DNA polymerase [Butyriboletus roseoflavus]
MSKTENKSLIVDIRNKNKVIQTHLVNKVSIPSMYDTDKWGILENKYSIDNITKYSISKGNYRIEILQTLSSRNVEIFNKNNKLIIQFTDNFKNDNYFIRTIKDTQYHFINEKLIVNIKDKKDTKFISKIKQDNVINNNIITMDLETVSNIINNEEVLSVISACIYDGENKYYFYLSDYNSSDDLLRAAIKSLMIDKYNDYKIYIHNLSRFDGIFLLRILAAIENTKLDILQRDDKMIALTLKYGNKCKITFHDSMLMLPSSLEELSNSFNIEIHLKS